MTEKPFRWNIAKREQLGRLLGETPRPNVNRKDFLDALRNAAARMLALAEGADLAFLGRTPENFFDYLSGIFHEIDSTPCLHLVHFSLRWAGPGGVRTMEPKKLDAFFDYLTAEGLAPEAIAKGPQPLALVDFVASGGTMQNFVELLHEHAKRDGVDWNAVQRKLRIIGLRNQTHNSPNTWRWQQHQDWLDLIPDAVIKNVSAPSYLVYYIANDQPKTTTSFHPGRWDDERAASPSHLSAERLEALALATALFDTGTTRDERQRLAARISAEPQMREATVRALVLKLRGL